MFKRFLAAVLTMVMVISPFANVTTAHAEDIIPADALELYYDFDGVNGTTVPDKSGNNNDGTLLNSAAIATDFQAGGRVLSLDNAGVSGTNAQGIGLPKEMFQTMEDVTLVMDVRLASTKNWTSLLAAGDGQSRYMVMANQGTPAIVGYASVGITNAVVYNGSNSNGEERIYAADASVKLPVGSWARLAYTQAADGTSKLYIDNELVAEGVLNTDLADLTALTGSQVRIGSNHIWGDPGLDGRVDNVRIYSAALTAEQLESIPWTISNETVGDVYFPELGENGLRADYYTFNVDELAFVDYKATYVEDNIESSNMESTLTTKAGTNDGVGAVWTGRIAAPEDGNYTFYAYCDNGIRVYMDGEVIIDWWVNQWDKEQTSAKIEMKAGEPHDFKVEWFEADGGSHITLRWANDQTVAKTAIPASAFYLPEGFSPLVVTEIDTTGAQLDRGQENFGGELVLKGQNLGTVETVEIVYGSGLPMAEPVYTEVLKTEDDALTIAVPNTLKAGYYAIKMTAGDLVTTTSETFSVLAASGESDRPEHPRPDWYRSDWINLNGWWDFSFDPDEVGLTEGWYNGEKEFEQQINVPFPWESSLSGITDTSYRGQAWYQRELKLDEAWLAEGKTVHIYFGAVDAKCKVYVNGQEVGSHNGGYTQFEFDITEYVQVGDNTITLWVEDKASYGDNTYPALVGKQGHNAPCGYTHSSGIWQTVYVESRTETYLDHAYANPDVKEGAVTYELGFVSDAAQTVTVNYAFESKLWDEASGEDVATGSAFAGSQTVEVPAGTSEIELEPIVIDNVKLWSDADPQLYYGTIEVTTADGTVLDSVDTYFGMREVYVDIYDDRDYEYVYVNDKPVFMSGLLDQGFWAEGIYTAPSEEALKYDILAMKNLGFNMIRKHLKIEDPLQYYWCDKLGVYVWQDMPHATDMNAGSAGEEAEGRPIYEEALYASLDRDYNHPSVIFSILFNETWGIKHDAPAASDGKTTHEWMEYLYYQVKDKNPNLLVEDMSACNEDHIQPTDINTFHMYPNGYADTLSKVKKYVNGQYEGSGTNFWGDYVQEQEPLFNSEYGGVGAFDKDYDVSFCFKYMTDIQRIFESMNGYVYTEPYDIEYERNGILSYDRRMKAFPYDEVAYGGDMTMVDLNQANYVGLDVNPALKVSQGTTYSANAVAMNWSGEVFENAVLKWRFDATDIYGNHINTDISGKAYIDYPAYTAETVNIKFVVPNEECVGTLTVWVEVDGEKIAKNFANIVVTGSPEAVEVIDDDTVALRDTAGTQEFAGVGTLTYEYAIPEGFDVDSLESLRMIVEASSVKAETMNYGISNSAFSQTTEGSERASDMTIAVNGIELDTVLLPDNPRDIRGTLSLDEGLCGGDSAGNFGYLVNINVPEAQMAEVKDAIIADGKIVVTYSVEADAKEQNGLRIYDDESGRYAVDPTIILNPNDLTANEKGEITPNAEDYIVSATLADNNSISIRGGILSVVLADGILTFGEESALVGEGAHDVDVRVFDDHYQVYVDNNPVPVIDVYDYTEFTSTVVVSDGTDLVVSPDKDAEGYAPESGEVTAVDKTELGELIVEAEARVESNYIDKTWTRFKSALVAAKEVYEDAEATQKTVDAAVKELIYASGYLEKVLVLAASYDMSNENGKVIDITGNGFDGTLVNLDADDFVTEGEDIAVTMTGTDGQYIELPAGIIEEEQFRIDITLKTSKRGNYYAWCIGTKEAGQADNHIFMGPKSGISASGVTGPIRAGLKFGGVEQLLGGGYAGKIADNVYTTISMDFNRGALTMYVDGQETATLSTGVSVQDILALAEADTPGVCGFIGKSLWSADRDFCGTITQFDIYATVEDSELVEDPVFEIVTQPVSTSAVKGEDATVFVEATGKDLTYTWYYKNPGSRKFYVSGDQFVSEDGASYTIPMYAWRDGQEVYCLITGANGDMLVTNTVKLTMDNGSIAITKQPEDVVVNTAGETAVVSVEASGEGLTYQWYYKNPGNVKFYASGDQFVSEDGTVYTIPVAAWRNGQQVYCVITDANGISVQTNTVTLTIAE